MADELNPSPKIVQFTNVDQAVSDALDAAAQKAFDQYEGYYQDQVKLFKQAELNNSNNQQKSQAAQIIQFPPNYKNVALVVGLSLVVGYYLMKGKIKL